MQKRAVITGLGVVSPVGIGTDANWSGLIEKRSGVGKLSRLSSEHLPVGIGAEVKNFNPKDFITDRKAVRLTFHNVHLALAAAKNAFDDCGLSVGDIDPVRIGAIVGSGGGGFDDGPGFEDLNEPILRSWDEETKSFDSAKFGKDGVQRAYPLFLLKALPNNAFYYISLLYNIQGENDNIVSSYTGGSQAIGDAFRAVRRGLADVIIAGGYDSLLTPNTVFSLDACGLLTKNADAAEACRPFDSRHDGMVAGEGAGFVIVEEYEHARRRGASLYAEIIGYGNASSAYHMYTPDPNGAGLIHAMDRALQDADLQPGAVDWLCADGISTPESDRAEAHALRAVFGGAAEALPVSAVKSMTGHMGSGSGAAEAVYSALAIKNAVLPPTANFTEPDGECALNIVTDPEEKTISTALSINQGLGGQSTALLFRTVD